MSYYHSYDTDSKAFPVTREVEHDSDMNRWATMLSFGLLTLATAIGLACSQSEAPALPGRKVQEQSRDHISPGQTHPAYSSVPATSGWHYAAPLAPARWGVHAQPLPDEVLVHNLEHGGIGVHYNCPNGCEDLVRQLAAIVNQSVNDGKKVIMSPYPGMDTAVALTAWTFIDSLDEFDERRVRDFISAHESSSNAPEPFVR